MSDVKTLGRDKRSRNLSTHQMSWFRLGRLPDMHPGPAQGGLINQSKQAQPAIDAVVTRVQYPTEHLGAGH